MTRAQLQAHVATLSAQVDTQEGIIKRLWLRISRLRRENEYLRREVERLRARRLTPEEIRQAVFREQ